VLGNKITLQIISLEIATLPPAAGTPEAPCIANQKPQNLKEAAHNTIFLTILRSIRPGINRLPEMIGD
jgi:hypothetical protein